MSWGALHPWLQDGYVAAPWGSSDLRWRVHSAAEVLGFDYVSARAFGFCAGLDPDSLTLFVDFALMIEAEANMVVYQRHQAIRAEQTRRAFEAQVQRQRRAAAALLLMD